MEVWDVEELTTRGEARQKGQLIEEHKEGRKLPNLKKGKKEQGIGKRGKRQKTKTGG